MVLLRESDIAILATFCWSDLSDKLVEWSKRKKMV